MDDIKFIKCEICEEEISDFIYYLHLNKCRRNHNQEELTNEQIGLDNKFEGIINEIEEIEEIKENKENKELTEEKVKETDIISIHDRSNDNNNHFDVQVSNEINNLIIDKTESNTENGLISHNSINLNKADEEVKQLYKDDIKPTIEHIITNNTLVEEFLDVNPISQQIEPIQNQQENSDNIENEIQKLESSLQLDERLIHPKWQIRKNSYIEIKKILKSSLISYYKSQTEESLLASSDIYSSFQSWISLIILDTNIISLQSALSTFEFYIFTYPFLQQDNKLLRQFSDRFLLELEKVLSFNKKALNEQITTIIILFSSAQFTLPKFYNKTEMVVSIYFISELLKNIRRIKNFRIINFLYEIIYDIALNFLNNTLFNKEVYSFIKIVINETIITFNYFDEKLRVKEKKSIKDFLDKLNSQINCLTEPNEYKQLSKLFELNRKDKLSSTKQFQSRNLISVDLNKSENGKSEIMNNLIDVNNTLINSTSNNQFNIRNIFTEDFMKLRYFTNDNNIKRQTLKLTNDLMENNLEYLTKLTDIKKILSNSLINEIITIIKNLIEGTPTHMIISETVKFYCLFINIITSNKNVNIIKEYKLEDKLKFLLQSFIVLIKGNSSLKKEAENMLIITFDKIYNKKINFFIVLLEFYFNSSLVQSNLKSKQYLNEFISRFFKINKSQYEEKDLDRVRDKFKNSLIEFGDIFLDESKKEQVFTAKFKSIGHNNEIDISKNKENKEREKEKENLANDTLTLDELDTNSIEESYKQENISISKIENDYNTILHIKENINKTIDSKLQSVRNYDNSTKQTKKKTDQSKLQNKMLSALSYIKNLNSSEVEGYLKYIIGSFLTFLNKVQNSEINEDLTIHFETIIKVILSLLEKNSIITNDDTTTKVIWLLLYSKIYFNESEENLYLIVRCFCLLSKYSLKIGSIVTNFFSINNFPFKDEPNFKSILNEYFLFCFTDYNQLKLYDICFLSIDNKKEFYDLINNSAISEVSKGDLLKNINIDHFSCNKPYKEVISKTIINTKVTKEEVIKDNIKINKIEVNNEDLQEKKENISEDNIKKMNLINEKAQEKEVEEDDFDQENNEEDEEEEEEEAEDIKKNNNNSFNDNNVNESENLLNLISHKLNIVISNDDILNPLFFKIENYFSSANFSEKHLLVNTIKKNLNLSNIRLCSFNTYAVLFELLLKLLLREIILESNQQYREIIGLIQDLLSSIIFIDLSKSLKVLIFLYRKYLPRNFENLLDEFKIKLLHTINYFMSQIFNKRIEKEYKLSSFSILTDILELFYIYPPNKLNKKLTHIKLYDKIYSLLREATDCCIKDNYNEVKSFLNFNKEKESLLLDYVKKQIN